MLPYLIVVIGFGLIVLSTEVPDKTDVKTFGSKQESAVIPRLKAQRNKKAHQKETKAPRRDFPVKRLKKLFATTGRSDVKELLVRLVKIHSEILKLLTDGCSSRKTYKHIKLKRQDSHKSMQRRLLIVIARKVN